MVAVTEQVSAAGPCCRKSPKEERLTQDPNTAFSELEDMVLRLALGDVHDVII